MIPAADDGRFTFEVGQPGRLDVAVAGGVEGLSRARATALIRGGHVRVDGVVLTRPAALMSAGVRVDVTMPPPAPSGAVAEDLPLSIVYADDDLVVVDKAPGMVVHPGAGHADGTLVNALLHHVTTLSGVGGVQRPGIVHRLDRGTSGLLVIATNDVSHRHLAAQFAAHTAKRRYFAICERVPPQPSGTFRSHLGRHPVDRVRFASVDEERGRHAVTHWRTLGHGRGLALLECALETGRTHQIRVHLSEAGWPILGDPMYGFRRAADTQPIVDPERPMLHAWRLDLDHPKRGPMRFVAALPDDLRAVLSWAGIEPPTGADQSGVQGRSPRGGLNAAGGSA